MEFLMTAAGMFACVILVLRLTRVHPSSVGPPPGSLAASMARHPAGKALRSGRPPQSIAAQLVRVFDEVERALDDPNLIRQARHMLRDGGDVV